MASFKLKRFAGPVLSVILFGAATWLLHHELKAYHFHEITGYIKGFSSITIWAAVGLTILSYAIMTCYDAMALRYVDHPLPYHKVGLASFIGYAFSNNIGLSMIAGASVRYRLYSAWGLSTFEIAQVIAFCTLTLWFGFLVLGGIVLIVAPMALPSALHIPFGSARALGFLMLGIVIAYTILSLSGKKTFSIKSYELKVPPTRLAALQIGVAVLDWILVGSVLFVLIGPHGNTSFFSFIQIFMLAQFSGLVSQVPGGIGVFEGVMVMLLSGLYPATLIFAALVVYRVIYYWIPLVAAAFLLGGQEVLRHQEASKKVMESFGRWVSPILPQVLGIAVMIGGVILLFSGAIPAMEGRLQLLKIILPLPFLEFSHFIGSLTGLGLILLGRGLQLRLDAAWVLTMILLIIGILSSIFKGLDYEEAIILFVIGAGVLPSRRYFYRKSSLFNERLNAEWVAAIVIAIGASIWLGMLSYRHVEYSNSLWWQFTFSGNASRFLRATVGVVVLLLFLAVFRLLRPVRMKSNIAEPEEMDMALKIVRTSPYTISNLALLGDKRFLFAENNKAFIMYGVEGRSWVSMGGPVGDREQWPELVWRFQELVDEYDGWPVFYEVGHENLYLYLDMGLSLIKLGEEARVPLADFSLEGSNRRGLRYTHRKLEKEGCRFDILTPDQIAPRLDKLREISDAWLTEKNTREKRFSMGSFLPDYLKQFSIAVILIDNEIKAFADIWQGADKEELAIDLMRFQPGIHASVMEYLFIQMMLWGKDQGYKWFNLGMAPFSGLENRSMAPLWNRLGAFIFHYGENFYNFQGLRQYKQKFDPIWQPKYLASPGGIALPQIFAGLAGLISGSIKGAVAK